MTHNTLHHPDAVILGAGPYGLSIAAHLRKKGANAAVFGKPMSLWQEHMPKDMLLRSRWWDTAFSDPERKYSLEAYLEHTHTKPYDPLPAKIIIDYGLWFKNHAVGEVDETFITSIEKNNGQFLIVLADGRHLTSKSVIMAPGLGYFAYKPAEFSQLPKQFVSHTYDNYGFDGLKGKRIAVVGGGQSALENAALLREAGIDVHLIHRSPIDWLSAPGQRSLWQQIRYPRAPIADGWDNVILLKMPYIFQQLPRSLKDYYMSGKGKHGPAGSHWLIPRLKNVTMHRQLKIDEVKAVNSHLSIKLSNNTVIDADHLILATGYKLDVARLPMLGQSILKEINLYHGSPVLSGNFESSIPGLYFAGFSAHVSFGPLFRFVVGTDAAARRITKAVTK